MVKVKICCGTNCYIMGACELISMDLTAIKGVEVEGSTCMNLCKDNLKRPPYVVINNDVHCEVTPTILRKLVEEQIDAV